jgi:hypothetical protein
MKIKLLLIFLIFLWLAFRIDWVGVNNAVTVNQPVTVDNNASVFQTTTIEELKINNEHDSFPNRCENYLIPIESLEDWKKNKVGEITRFYQNLKNTGVSDDILDHISILSGVNILKGRDILSLRSQTSSLPIFAAQNAFEMLEEEEVLFEKLLDSDNKVKLLEAFEGGKIPLNGYSSMPFKTLSPISHVLLNSKDLAFTFKLIKLGTKATYSDLVTATELVLPVDYIDFLFQSSGLSASTIFKTSPYYSSLTTIAVKARTPELVKYWLSLGSPATPDPFFIFGANSVDLIALPENENENDKRLFLEMFILLMKDGARPGNVINIGYLKSWLPKDILEQYESIYAKTYDNSLPEQSKALVHYQISELYRIVLRGLLKPPNTDTIEHECFLFYGMKMTKVALEREPLKISDFFTDEKWHKAAIKKESAFDIEKKKLLSDIETNGTSFEEAIAILSQRNDLAGKLAIQDLTAEKLVETAKSQQEMNKEGISEYNVELIESAFKSDPNDWEAVNNILSEVELLPDEDENGLAKLTLKLTLAISTNQPWSVIKNLINQGGILPANTLFILIQQRNIELTKKLAQYGLDIHVKDVSGKSAIHHCVAFNAEKILAFLISKRVSLQTEYKGLDPLDQAFLQVEYQPTMFNIIKIILKGNFNIQLSHKERVLSYATSAPELHAKLIQTFPELI